MRNIEKAFLYLNSYQVNCKENSIVSNIDPRAFILVTFVYLFSMLSLPLYQTERLIWFAVYPILMAPMSNVKYSSLFYHSLIVLPFVVLIGIFNPVIDTREAFKIGNMVISIGWLSFFSIIIRGLLSMQALLLLIRNYGFIQICNSLRSFGCPKVLTVQLFLIYRFVGVLLEETINMKRAIISRGYGKNTYSIKLWTRFIGSLFIRCLNRSKNIHYGMVSRGFEGSFPVKNNYHLGTRDYLFSISWIIISLFLHYFNLSQLFYL